MDLGRAIEFIKNGDKFLLSSHVNPDGDGVGSIIGMLGLLRQLGKSYSVICADKPQDKLAFLERFDEFVPYENSMFGKMSFDHAIIIDSPFLDRIGDPAKLIKTEAKILNIDHHIDGGNFGTVNLIVPEAAASAQIVSNIFRRMGVPFDKDSATALYVGLSVDTGRFRFSNTTSEVLRLAADLVDAGVKPDEIADKLYYQTSLENKIGLAKVLSSIELHFDGKVASSWLDSEFLSSAVGKELDSEGFVNQALSIKGVQVAFLIRETEKSRTRVSVRSRNDAIDVNKIARVFSGGGHMRAAGCKITGSVQDVKARLLAELAPVVGRL